MVALGYIADGKGADLSSSRVANPLAKLSIGTKGH
jgi:hypothetical protein